MSILVFTIIIGLSMFSGCSAKTPVGPAKPEIDHLEFNWGRIPQDVVVTHIYNFKNSGGDSIIIEELRPHCGCTSAPLKTQIIRAGETVPLELRFNSRGYRGKSRKSAALRYNTGGESVTKQLFFDAFVDTMSVPFTEGQIGVDKPIVEFDQSVETIEIELTNHIAAARELVVVDYQADRIELSWQNKPIAPKESVKLRIKRKIPTESLFATITLEMKGHDNTRITIPVLGKNRQTEQKPGIKSGAVSRPQPQAPNNPWLDDPNLKYKAKTR